MRSIELFLVGGFLPRELRVYWAHGPVRRWRGVELLLVVAAVVVILVYQNALEPVSVGYLGHVEVSLLCFRHGQLLIIIRRRHKRQHTPLIPKNRIHRLLRLLHPTTIRIIKGSRIPRLQLREDVRSIQN
jgi:hypothetical protein